MSLSMDEISMSVKSLLDEVYGKAKGTGSIMEDRFHLSEKKWCECLCHGYFEAHSIIYDGCLHCHYDNMYEITRLKMEKCNCGYTPRLCSTHRGKKTKRAN